MEVLKEKAAMLCNFEVYSLLQQYQAEKKDGKRKKTSGQNLATISYEALKYLDKTPCKYQNEDVIEEFLVSLERFNLTKAEKLQLLNLRPTTPVEIQLIVEESEERLKTDQEIEDLLNIIEKLPELETGNEEEEEMAQGDDSLE